LTVDVVGIRATIMRFRSFSNIHWKCSFATFEWNLALTVPFFSFLFPIPSASGKDIHRSAEWKKLVDQYFSDYFEVHPSLGRYAGLHQYDSKLEDYSGAGVKKATAISQRYVERFTNFNPESRSTGQAQDRRFAINQTEGSSIGVTTNSKLAKRS
jgi:hypothetical protein